VAPNVAGSLRNGSPSTLGAQASQSCGTSCARAPLPTSLEGKYQRRRDVLTKGLWECGWWVDAPKAFMYVWARIPESHRLLGSLECAKQLLAKAKDSVSPRIGFGELATATCALH